MIELTARIDAFVALGKRIQNLDAFEKEELFRRAGNKNNWFTPKSCETAFEGLSFMLQEDKLKKWLSAYSLEHVSDIKDVGVLMAGNIPAVGFHDMMTVLLSGHKLSAKLSSADEVLMKWLIGQLIEIEPDFEKLIETPEMLKGKDAYIATGSDNSARYFNYYFGKYPSVIRQNRTSIAVLDGSEGEVALKKLGVDILTYFGLGCRNVSKIFIQSEEELTRLLDALNSFSEEVSLHKFHNNYEYNKSIYLVNGEKHLDNGFLILKESEELVSPIAVVYYEIYDSEEKLKEKLGNLQSKIQCVVADPVKWEGAVSFGEAQFPEPWNYADGVDTLKFLTKL